MAQGILERFDSPEEEQRLGLDNAAAKLRVAIPGIIESFDPGKQTATVQPAITENIRLGQEEAKPTKLPVLTDVPVFFPRAGGYCLTFPVKKGDECMLVFSDMCIDGWWQSGGVQDQVETRRHDLSDAQAFLGITSVPRAVKNYSANSLMLRNEDKDSYFEIVDNSKTLNIISAEKINITAVDDVNVTTAANVNVKAAQNINVTATADITIKAGGNMTLEAGGNFTVTAARIDLNS